MIAYAKWGPLRFEQPLSGYHPRALVREADYDTAERQAHRHRESRRVTIIDVNSGGGGGRRSCYAIRSFLKLKFLVKKSFCFKSFVQMA